MKDTTTVFTEGTDVPDAMYAGLRNGTVSVFAVSPVDVLFEKMLGVKMLLVIVAGLYLIGAVGYYKLVTRLAQGLIQAPFIFLILAVVWPVMIAITLFTEAVK